MCVFTLQLSIFCKSQELLFIAEINNKKISISKSSENKFELSVDNIIRDTIQVLPNYSIYNYCSDKYFFKIPNGYKNEIYLLKTDSINFLSKIFSTDINYIGYVNKRLIGLERKEPFYEPSEVDFADDQESGGMKNDAELVTKVIAYDIDNNKKEVIIDIESHDNLVNEYEDIVDLIISPSKILLVLGVYETGEYLISNYLIYDLSEKQLSKYSFDQKYELTDFDKKFKVPQISNRQNLLYTNQFIFTYNYLFSHDFSMVQSIVPRTTKLPYYNNDGLNILSVTDSLKFKWGKKRYDKAIQYDIEPNIEKVLYKIYNGFELLDEELKSLTKKQLILAKKMIYAKSNSYFNDKLDQAFFNSFEFYNSQFKTRIEKVKLNQIDILNKQKINKLL
jgi:hypothetical protein